MQKRSDKKENDNLVRGLSSTHVQLIALGGTIGTGLFLGAGHSISLTGPSIIFVYFITGMFIFTMMRAIGEMLFMDPSQKTFINFITKYLGKGIGTFAGWSYWIALIFLGMSEITAIGKYFAFWFPGVPEWLTQLIFIILLSSINLTAVKLFGVTESWFASIKIFAILALIATAVMMMFTGFVAPDGTHASLANVFENFQLFPNGGMNFILAFPMVFFAYQAIEFVGVTTAETQNPHKVLPKVINSIIFRILFFYIGALLAIMIIEKWTQLKPEESPFVNVFGLIGINWAASLINFVVLTAAASALNSTLYSTGRNLLQLAENSHSKLLAPITRINKRGIPATAIIISALAIMLSPLINSLPALKNAFIFLTSASSGTYIIIYVLIMVAHYKYRSSDDFLENGFILKGYKWFDIFTILFFIFVFITLFLQSDSLPAAEGSLLWAGGFAVIYLLNKKLSSK